MKFARARGSTSNIFDFFLPDTQPLVPGGGKTGLSSASSGLIIALKRELSSAYTVYAQASSNIETITTIGTFAAPSSSKCRFKEIDSTNAPGKYQVMFADALFDTSDASRWISGVIHGASGLVMTPFEIMLTAFNFQDAVRGGLTALPNANSGAQGGLVILDDVIVSTVVDASPTTTAFKGATTLSSSDDYYNGCFLVPRYPSALVGIPRMISAYVGATRQFQFNGATGALDAAFPTAIANGDGFLLIGRGA